MFCFVGRVSYMLRVCLGVDRTVSIAPLCLQPEVADHLTCCSPSACSSGMPAWLLCTAAG